MEIPTELLTFSVAVITSALSIAYYMGYKGRPKNALIQGFTAVIGGLISLISLFLPWLTIGELELPGFNLGNFFVYILNNQFVTMISFFLIFFAFLITFAGFLLILGYNLAKGIIRTTSTLSIIFTVIIVLCISLVPSDYLTEPLSLTPVPWVCLFGAVVGIISTKLEK